MADGYKAYMTYMLISESGTTNGDGYSDAIHCNYINSIEFEDINNKEFNIYFQDPEEFKFLSAVQGSGFTAHKIIVLAQLINLETGQTEPKSDEWAVFDVTEQVSGYTSGQTISAQQLTSMVFRVPINLYNLAITSGNLYSLDYLGYPSDISEDKLSFGDETYFIGNVTSSVEAIAYTTDLAINLPLDEFNSTTNPTWDQESEVYITEVGLYDDKKNLVGIAKLNNPIPKDSTISRTIVFGLDF